MCRKLFFSGTVLVVLLSYSLVVSVESSSLTWSQAYGGIETERAYSMVNTTDGGYALAGIINHYDRPSLSDCWLVKTDEFGNMEWNRTYGGESEECAYSLVATSDGGYALAGSIGSRYSEDFWLVKTDEFGNEEWNRTYEGQGAHIAQAVVKTSDGGYALAGGSLLVKTDENGDMEWSKTYDGSCYSLIELDDGGYAIAGTSDYDFWLVKTDEFGNEEWNRTYGGEHGDYGRSVIETSDGGYAIAGYYYPAVGIFENPYGLLVKTDAYGNEEWNRTYGGGDEDEFFSVVEASDGGYALAGYTWSYDRAGWSDFWLVKTDEYGEEEWRKTYGGSSRDEAFSLVETSDGGYAIAGWTDSYDVLGDDFWLVKTDEYGDPEIVPEYTSWLIPSVLLAATAIILIYKKNHSINVHKKPE